MGDNNMMNILAIAAASAIMYGLIISNKSHFVGEIRELKPLDFTYSEKDHPLTYPPNKEEIGTAQVYPQGSGVSMSADNSDALPKDTKLEDHTTPEAYGQSSLGNENNYFEDGMKIINLKSMGEQGNFKGMYFNDKWNTNVKDDFFNAEQFLQTETLPGKDIGEGVCETMYPPTTNYKNKCIIEGDIPYGEIVNGKVNPRLLSRWEFYTNQYDPNEKLSQSGLMFPRV